MKDEFSSAATTLWTRLIVRICISPSWRASLTGDEIWAYEPDMLINLQSSERKLTKPHENAGEFLYFLRYSWFGR